MNLSLNRTGVIYLQNKSGGLLAQGDIAIVDTSNALAITTTTTPSYADGMVDVILDPAGIADEAIGLCAYVGPVPKINLSSSASVGDLIATSATPGEGTPHIAPFVSGDFAQALESGASPSAILLGTPTPIPASGLALISSQTASASAVLDFTNIPIDDYETFIFEMISLLPATSGVDLYARMSTDNGVTFDSGNHYFGGGLAFGSAGTGTFGTNEGAPDTKIFLRGAAEIGNGSNYGVAGNFSLFKPKSSIYKYSKFDVSFNTISGVINSCVGGFSYMSTSYVDAIRFYFSSGNIQSGKINMYGLKG